MERWKGKVALVTGASSGIGRQVALDLSGAGLRVAVTARRRERLEELEGAFLVAPADLRSERQVLEAFAHVREAWGGVDLLVNAAGVGHQAPLLTGSSAEGREMLEGNVLALSIATREAVADMRRRGDEGHVVHVSSLVAHRDPPGGAIYAATKCALRALTEALRRELHEARSRIRVSCVSPGLVETEFHERYFGDVEAGRRFYREYRVLEPRDVSAAVLWAIDQPEHVQVHDVLVRSREQPH